MVLVHYWQDENGCNTHVEAKKMDSIDETLAIYHIAKGLEMTKQDLANVIIAWDILTEIEEDENK